MRLLVSGGAGFIGSVVAARLVAGGHEVTVLDDLSTGHDDAVPRGAAFIRGSIRDKAASVLAERGIEVVLHFAASSQVGESVANPACIRDYIHVTDLADAHLRALDACQPGRHRIYNLGNGSGFSVREVIDVCRSVTGRDIPVKQALRRPGDPAILVASARRIQSHLGWQARRDLRAMVADAWQAMQVRATHVEE